MRFGCGCGSKCADNLRPSAHGSSLALAPHRTSIRHLRPALSVLTRFSWSAHEQRKCLWMNRSRQCRLACEKHVDGMRGRPSLGNRPHDQRRPAMRSPQTNTPGVRVCHPTSHSILPSGSVPTSKSVSSGRFRRRRNPSEQSQLAHQIRRVAGLHQGPLSVLSPATRRPEPSGLRGPHRHRRREIPAPPIGIVCHCPPRLPAELRRTRGHNGHGSRSRSRCAGEWDVVIQFRHRARALAMHRAEAVGRRVAATDDHDVLTSRRDARRAVTLAFAVGRTQVLHRTWIPRRPRPGTSVSRARSAPTARTTASNSS